MANLKKKTSQYTKPADSDKIEIIAFVAAVDGINCLFLQFR